MRLPVVILLLLLSAKLFAQEQTEKVKPLILVDTLFTYNESMILHPSKFISISTISAEKATQLYGNTGRYGVIRIRTIQDVQLVRLEAILNKFKVEDRYRKLKVCVDRSLISEPEKLLADINEIKNVEIITGNPGDSELSRDVAFINIITQAGF